MRAATVIVGAIAMSSCLIALVLVLTAGNSNGKNSSARPARRQAIKANEAGGTAINVVPSSGPVQCNVEVTVEGGSCFLGKNVLDVYENDGSAALAVIDPESGEEVSFECKGTAPTVCSSPSGVRVYLAP